MAEVKDDKQHLLIYCDGGCVNNGQPDAISGYGIHMVVGDRLKKPVAIQGTYKLANKGYMTKLDFAAEDLVESANNEGSLNPTDGSIYDLALSKVIDIYGYHRSSLTNNQAELDAAIEALSYLRKLAANPDTNPDEVTILSDSTYVLGYIHKIVNGTLILNDITVNKDHIVKLTRLIVSVNQHYKFHYRKVPAHDINIGNNRADMLATTGITANTNGGKTPSDMEVIIEDDSYWRPSKLDTSLFYTRQLFEFHSKGPSRSTYYGLNYKSESDVGKRLPYITYTVYKLEEKDPILDKVFGMFATLLKDLQIPHAIKVSELFNKTTIKDYLRYGNNFVKIVNKGYTSVVTSTKVEVAREIYPVGLSHLVMDRMRLLEQELTDYLTDKKMPNITYVDITDELFETNEKGKNILKKDIVNDSHIVHYKYDGTKIKVRLKQDTLPRNNLRHLESHKPKVILSIRDRGDIIVYKTIVVIPGKGAILNSNVYGNVVIKKLRK